MYIVHTNRYNYTCTCTYTCSSRHLQTDEYMYEYNYYTSVVKVEGWNFLIHVHVQCSYNYVKKHLFVLHVHIKFIITLPLGCRPQGKVIIKML